MNLPDTVSGFAVIPASYAPGVTHIFYAKAHTSSKLSDNKLLPKGRTLFLVNVPPDATERELSLFFKNAGHVERVVFDSNLSHEETLNASSESEEDEEDSEKMQVDGEAQDGERPSKRRRKGDKEKSEKPIVKPLPFPPLRELRKTGKAVYVIFLDETSIKRALTPPHKPRPWPRSEEPMGLARYIALYDAMRPPLDAVREYAESAIALFDYEEAQKKQTSQYRKGEAVVDEDGFTLVTRGGAYGQTLGGGVGVASKRFQATGEASTTSKRQKKKKEKKEKDGFYGFQKHEKKRQGK